MRTHTLTRRALGGETGVRGGRRTDDRVSTCTGLGTPEWKALCFATCRSRQVVETKDALRKTTFSEEVSYPDE